MHSPDQHDPDERFGGAVVGTRLGPVPFTVSEAANERYWAAAEVDHPLRHQGALYPPMAANLTILCFQTVATRPLLHTAQRLVTHRLAHVPAALAVTGTVVERSAKRGREYAVVEAEITVDDELLWTSLATFTEVER